MFRIKRYMLLANKKKHVQKKLTFYLFYTRYQLDSSNNNQIIFQTKKKSFLQSTSQNSRFMLWKETTITITENAISCIQPLGKLNSDIIFQLLSSLTEYKKKIYHSSKCIKTKKILKTKKKNRIFFFKWLPHCCARLGNYEFPWPDPTTPSPRSDIVGVNVVHSLVWTSRTSMVFRKFFPVKPPTA